MKKIKIKELDSFKKYLNESPSYKDYDYLDFEPMESRSLSYLKMHWSKLKPYKNNEVMVFINKRKTIALLGVSQWDKDRKSWQLKIATWVKLDDSKSSNGHRQVRGVFTHEDVRGEGYTFTLYMTLYKAGIKLESDNDQYLGAKPLWKGISRVIDVQVYDEVWKKVIHNKYNEMEIPDIEIWSEDGKHFYKLLRMK